MARYVDADKIDFSPLKDDFDRARAKVIIMGQPTADVVEVKHGYWKLTKTEFGWNGCEYPTEYTCTVCGGISPCCEESYCPNCGAKMDGRSNT